MANPTLMQILEQHRTSLQHEQRDLEAELQRVALLGERQAEVAAELSQVEAKLAEVAKRRQLDLLGRVKVASPCSARWEEMRGDERVRFCQRCSKHVYDLSAMTSEQALALVYEQEGDLCVRFYRRADGTLLTSDCPDGRRRRRLVLAFVAAAAATVAGACALQQTPEPETHEKASMGALTL